MMRRITSCTALLGLCLLLMAAAAYAGPNESIIDAVANSGVFPAGTTVVNITGAADSIAVDLSLEAITPNFEDAQSDAYVEAINGALVEWPEITNIEITVGGSPLWNYLPQSSQPAMASASAGFGVFASQDPLLRPNVTPTSNELAGKLVVLHPSHGSYATASSWVRAQRTFCGPNPVTNRPPGLGNYQPSDYYYWTKGFTWPMYYEDDMSPETIRFLYAYCQSSGAATFCSRNLDKNSGEFPYASYGYPTPPTSMRPLPRWQVASKYNLQDIGLPQSVWDEPSLTAEDSKDIRARAYYANYLMQTLGYSKDNSISFSLHSNAATTGNPSQSQARGTETYWYSTQYPTEQARSKEYCTAVENAVISAIRTKYDGTWAELIYNATLTPLPREWYTSYGTYRGYVQDGNSYNRWQDRGVKTSNFGEIRECKMPAQLMELLFHDDWKFYPDQAFHQDRIFRATVAWGMYEGFCSFFGVTPKPRLAASIDSANFPTIVGPGQAISGTIMMKNLGQAWCWGDKMIGTVYSPYTVWFLKAANDDQFGAAGTEIALADDGNYYPGDIAEFDVSLTAPATTGLYTTKWQMIKDDVKGGSFGPVVTAQVQVDADAPEITISKPTEGQLYGPSVTAEFSAVDALSEVKSLSAEIDGTEIASGASVTLATGSHTLTVTAVDTFGNTAVKSVTFRVDADGPVITITSPVAGNYQHFGSVTASFDATDSPAGVASISATFDGQPIANGDSISLLWNSLGTHTLAVTAVDNVGNTSTASVSFTAIASIESLIGAVNQLYAGGMVDNQGITNSLLVKLAKYEKDNGYVENARNYLKNFLNEVAAQSGKHITVPAADLLTTDANYIIAHLAD